MKIKQLEWTVDANILYEAQGIHLVYRISPYEHDFAWEIYTFNCCDGEFVGYSHTIEEAKQIAQKDHEKTIKEWLEKAYYEG